MKKTVKLLATLLALVFALSVFAFAVSAAPAEGVVLNGAAETNPGDTYKLEVVIKAPVTFTNIEFEVTFDDAAFSLTKEDIEVGAAMPRLSSFNMNGNVIKFAGASATAANLTSDSVLATLNFKAKDGITLTGDVLGSASVSVSKLNNNGNAVYADGLAADDIVVTVKHAHDYTTKSETESVAPDCDDPGYDRYYCACGEHEDTPVPETGHSYANEWTPVAGEDKWFENVCSGCDASIKTYLPDPVTNEEFGATVSVDKGAFSEVVTPVVKPLDEKTEAKVKEELAKVGEVKAAYYFEVGFDSQAGYNTVINAAGTTIAVDLDILDALKDLYYKVVKVSADGVEDLGEKNSDNKVAFDLSKPSIIAVYALEDSSVPGGATGQAPEAKPPVSTGDNSVLPIAIVVMVLAVLAAGTTLVLKKKKS